MNREKEYRHDWIFIVDFTIELGQQKALVVLGISQEHFREKVVSEHRGLSHSDVELLGLEIMNSTKGELIEQQLDKIILMLNLKSFVGKLLKIFTAYNSSNATTEVHS